MFPSLTGAINQHQWRAIRQAHKKCVKGGLHSVPWLRPLGQLGTWAPQGFGVGTATAVPYRQMCRRRCPAAQAKLSAYAQADNRLSARRNPLGRLPD